MNYRIDPTSETWKSLVNYFNDQRNELHTRISSPLLHEREADVIRGELKAIRNLERLGGEKPNLFEGDLTDRSGY